MEVPHARRARAAGQHQAGGDAGGVRPRRPPPGGASSPWWTKCLTRLSPRFKEMYANHGRPSIPPEHLLKGSLLIALYSVRSERQFCEQVRYNLLSKRFLDLYVDDEPFAATTFSKNRERMLEGRWRAPSSPRWWPRRAAAGCSWTSTSRSTGRCWKRGPRSRATGRGTSGRRLPGVDATPRGTSRVGGAAARRTSRARTRRRGCIARGRSRRRS